MWQRGGNSHSSARYIIEWAPAARSLTHLTFRTIVSTCGDSASFVHANKQLVIISLSMKLNHIPGKGNIVAFFFFKWEKRMHF